MYILFSDEASNEDKKEEARPPFFRAIDLLCRLLNHHISEAAKDLIKSSMSYPMYGVIQSIRGAYESVGSASYTTDPLYHRQAMADVISTCDDVAKLVSPVVCSSSPEGFLPDTEDGASLSEDRFSDVLLGNDQSESREDSEKIMSPEGVDVVSSKNAESAIVQGTAQSLLLCCWHSMKEIALLLGYFVEYAPVVSELTSTEEKGIIAHTQVSIT